MCHDIKPYYDTQARTQDFGKEGQCVRAFFFGPPGVFSSQSWKNITADIKKHYLASNIIIMGGGGDSKGGGSGPSLGSSGARDLLPILCTPLMTQDKKNITTYFQLLYGTKLYPLFQ